MEPQPAWVHGSHQQEMLLLDSSGNPVQYSSGSIVLDSTVLQCCTVQYSTVHYSTVQYSTVQYIKGIMMYAVTLTV